MAYAQPQPKAIHHLNALLRGEFAAIEMYERAAYALADDAIPELLENRGCHIRRAIVLADAIRSRGGRPVSGAGARGAVIANRNRAPTSDRRRILDWLEELEAGELADYRMIARVADGTVVDLLGHDLEPAGQNALRRIKGLRPAGEDGAHAPIREGDGGARP